MKTKLTKHCTHCGWVYANDATRPPHETIAHGQRIYVCPWCDQDDSLRTVEVTLCPVCRTTFTLPAGGLACDGCLTERQRMLLQSDTLPPPCEQADDLGELFADGP